MQDNAFSPSGASRFPLPSHLARFGGCLLAVLTVALATNSVRGADDAARPRRPGSDLPQGIIDAFDANKDGELDEAERTKARQAMAQRRKKPSGFDRRELMKRFDKDGDGRLNETERQAAMSASRADGGPGRRPPGNQRDRPANREAFMKRFDANGDGKLDDDERAAARKAFENRPTANGDRPRPANPNAGPAGPNGARPTTGPRRPGEFLKRFDKDGDGKLDDAERAAARAAFEARPGNGRPGNRRNDRPGVANVEKPDSGRVDKKALLEKFDSDGDGKLQGEERAAARKAFEQANRKDAKD